MENRPVAAVPMTTLALETQPMPLNIPSSEATLLQENFKTCSVEAFDTEASYLNSKPSTITVKFTNFPELSINSLEHNHSIVPQSQTNPSQTGITQPLADQSQILLLSSQPVLDSSDLEKFSTDLTTIVGSGYGTEETPTSVAQSILQNQKYFNVCRICANEAGKTIPLFHSEGITLGLVEKIHQCLPIEVSIDDELPQQICDDCISKLDICHDFINLSIEGSDKLKGMVKLDMQPEVTCIVEETKEGNPEAVQNFEITLESESEHVSSDVPFAKISGDNIHSPVAPTSSINAGTKTDHKERQWSCSECDYKASRQSSLALHKLNKHKVKQNIPELVDRHYLTPGHVNLLVCEYCGKNFESKLKWKKHMFLHAKSGALEKEIVQPCTSCSEIFCNSKDLQRHKKSVHSFGQEGIFSCDKCNKSFRMARSLDIHLATHSKETPYLCDICGKSFKHGSNLRSHRRSHGDLKLTHRHACDLCPKSFPSKFHLNEHKNVHLNIAPYSCGVCGKRFHRRIQLRQHCKIHTRSSFECPQCGVTFNRRGNMTQHMKRHMKEQKFTCKVCKESFQTLSAVVQHRRQHTEQQKSSKDHTPSDAKFQCEICSKLLSNRRTLDYHIRSFHTQERPFSCQFCSETFVSREGCLVHERHHTGEKPYSCSKCAMSFRCSSNLAQHLKTHEDERPWKCDHCPKSFKRKGVLLVHIRTHTGEKPFCCDVCGRRFTQKNDMLKHQQTHTAAKQTFVCGDCSWPFHSRKDLNKHRRAHHINARVESSISCMPVLSSHSQAMLINDDFCQFPITIVEEGGNVIVHQIEDLPKDTQTVEINPSDPNSSVVHFTDSLLQAVTSESQIVTIHTSGQHLVQLEDVSDVKTVICSSTQQNW